MTLAIGSLTFGGGYALIPVLHFNLVIARGLITNRDFGDSLAIGQITPGPISIMIAFIGCQIAGWPGAVLGIIGLNLPAAALVVLIARFFQGFKENPIVRRAIRGINLVVIGLLGSVVILLGRTFIVDFKALAIAGVSFVIVLLWKKSPVFVILGAAAVGILIYS